MNKSNFNRGKMERLTIVVIAMIAAIMLSGSSGTGKNQTPCTYCEGTGDCKYCEGSGVCGTCDGTGVNTTYYKTFGKVTMDCFGCKGSGDCYGCGGSGECKYCDGTGYKEEKSSNDNSHKRWIIPDIHEETVCSACNGTGRGTFKCTYCKGTGEDPLYESTKGHALHGFTQKTCSICNGTGYKVCSVCKGSGKN